MRIKSGVVIFVVLLGLVSGMTQAEVYKWKDANGRWHFSDQPHDGAGKVVIHSKPSSSGGEKEESKTPSSGDLQGKDIAAHLASKYQSGSMLEKTTLAVVGVETHLGQGSGFFVSDDGYIVTNRHVLRPGSTRQWQQSNQQNQQAADSIDRSRRQLQQEDKSLKDYKKDLDRYKQYVDDKPKGSSRQLAQKEYNTYLKNYEKRKARYERNLEQFKQSEKAFKAAQSEFDLKSSMANAASRFKVVLKDNTEIYARLIKISKKLDLGLLKAESYTTPSLKLKSNSRVLQGDKVFAIGSPLGIRDSVTSGIITRLDDDYLITDAQILPGNSGGPLIDEKGEVIGVNTMKYGASANAEGFGLAIPVDEIRKEFGQYFER